MRIVNTIEIRRAPREVFPWIKDPARAMQWQSGVAGGEILRETPDMVGTVFRERIEENGRGTDMEGVITEYVADKKIAFHLDGKYNTVDVEFEVEPSGDFTRFSQKANIRFKSFLGIASIILGPLMKKKIRKQSRADLAKLKELCER